MSKSYDLIVIGSGTAAMVATSRAAAAGWKVGVTDFRPFGGTCALRGCDPKKMLVTGAQVMDDIGAWPRAASSRPMRGSLGATSWPLSAPSPGRSR